MSRSLATATVVQGNRPSRRALPPGLDPARLPSHVAVIMDGNGRWAGQRKLPRVMGHREGVEALKRTLRLCSDWGIGALTAYAFSTEETDPHLLALQGLEFPGQHPLEQRHQEAHLLAGAAPVLGGEGVGGEGADAPVAAQTQGALQGLHTFAVAHHPRQFAMAGPAAIAVHDHRHMAG